MLKTILAVVAGFILWSVIWLGGNSLLAGFFPGAVVAEGGTGSIGFLVTLLVLSVVASVASGYVTRAISPASGRAPLVLGVLLLLVGVAVQSGFWNVMPLWYHAVFLVAIIPGVLFGAKLRK